MVGQHAAPGVQDTEDPDEPPDVLRVGGAREARVGGGAEHEVVQVLLLAADALPQCWGQGQDPVNRGDREQFPAPVCQPGFGVEAMPCGAATVAAGVVDSVCLTTELAWQQLSAPRLGPAGEESLHGPAMAGPQGLPKPGQVLAAVPPPDVRHLGPVRAPAPVEISHEGGAGGVHHVQGRGRQRRVAGGGPGALVAQQCLEVDAGPGALQRARGAEPKPGEVNAEGALGALLLMAPEEDLLAHLLVAELGRRASVVVHQLADRVERALGVLGAWPRSGRSSSMRRRRVVMVILLCV
jgi:hypothetical protein